LTSGHSDAQPWASQCPDVKNYKWRLNPVWHSMLCSYTHMATVGDKGLIWWHWWHWYGLSHFNRWVFGNMVNSLPNQKPKRGFGKCSPGLNSLVWSTRSIQN